MENLDLLEELRRKFGSKYLVTVLAAKRAKQLQMGDHPPLIPNTEGKDPLTIALEELAAGRLLVEDEGVTPVGPEAPIPGPAEEAERRKEGKEGDASKAG
ncbi:MAG TPA: DNA-directed RNA polymerase subunit omega [Armatimonadetes bacterium]|nr:DNA-directed RNA polymerase subunit omega [Armatimonadota bacterium]